MIKNRIDNGDVVKWTAVHNGIKTRCVGKVLRILYPTEDGKDFVPIDTTNDQLMFGKKGSQPPKSVRALVVVTGEKGAVYYTPNIKWLELVKEANAYVEINRRLNDIIDNAIILKKLLVDT